MFDINQVDRNVELFIFDIYIAIQKIKQVSVILIGVKVIPLFKETGLIQR